MKKVVLGLIMILAVSTVHAQETRVERQAKFYAEKCAEQYNLNDKQKEDLYNTRVEMLKIEADFIKRNKKGEFASKEEFKNKRNKAKRPLFLKLLEITGQEEKEFSAFNKTIVPEMKKMK